MMTVKQLEWKSGPRGQAASTPFGTSYILDNRDGKHWFLYRENGNGRVKLLTSEAKAKACAQEEYERLILSAVARPQPAAVRDEATSLPQDVINLVIAAREFWDANNDLSPESLALDVALDGFARRVPFDNEPDALHSTQEG